MLHHGWGKAFVDYFRTLEASLAGKPPLMVLPLPMPQDMELPWHDLVPTIDSEAALLDACLEEIPPVSDALASWARDTLLG